MPQGQFISLDEAKQMISIYHRENENILAEGFKGRGILPTCETFDRDLIERLFSQPGCTRLRIYFGMDENLLVKAVIVGVDENDQDILPEEEGIVEKGYRCPTMCPPTSELTSNP